MGIIAWLILGAAAGWIASMFMGTDAKQGAFMNIVVGIIGAMIGGFVFNLAGGVGITGFNIWSLVVSVIGACILLGIVRLFSR